MIRLLRPELTRYATRRVTWVGAVCATLLIWVTTGPLMNSYSYTSRYRDVFDVGVGLQMMVVLFAGALAYFSAASYIGSEQSSGALGTWLTFTPTRHRVLAAKFITVGLVTGAYATLMSLGGALLAWGVTPDARGGDVLELFGLGARVVVVVVTFALLGLAIALIGRNTLSALGALVGYLVLVLLHLFVQSALRLLSSEWWGLERVLFEFLASTDYSGYTSRNTSHFDYANIVPAGVGWLVFVAVVMAVAHVVFAHRDLD